MEVSLGSVDDQEQVELLGRSHPFASTRAFARFGFDIGGLETARRLIEALHDPDSTVAIGRVDGAVVACAAIGPLAFETATFGIPTGRLVEVVVDGATLGDRSNRAAELLATLGRAWGERGGELVIGQIDAEDHGALAGAQRAGFTVLEAATTYLADHRTPPPHRHQDKGYRIERHTAADVGTIDPGSLARLERWASSAFRHGHFHADPSLPPGAADEFYRRWMRNTFSGVYGDVVFTAWRGDEVVGFVSWIAQPHLRERYGLDFLAGGLGAAIDPEGTGALGDIYAAVTAPDALGASFAEHPTQLSNLAVHATFARFPVLRLAETHHCVHGWFGRATA